MIPESVVLHIESGAKTLVVARSDDDVYRAYLAIKTLSDNFRYPKNLAMLIDPKDKLKFATCYLMDDFVGVTSSKFLKDKLPKIPTILKLKVGDVIPLSKVAESLSKLGYFRVSVIGVKGDFSIRGDTVDVFSDKAVRVEFFSNKVERIFEFNPETFKVERDLDEVVFSPIRLDCKEWIDFEDAVKPEKSINLDDEDEVMEDTGFVAEEALNSGYTVFVVGRDFPLLNAKSLFELEGEVHLKGEIKRGFMHPASKIAWIPERKVRKRKVRDFGLKIEGVEEIEQGDFVVHKVHGIGMFCGTAVEEGREFLKIEYAGEDVLYIPAEDVRILSKYTGLGGKPPLDKLGGATFHLRKRRVKAALERYASDLLRIYALKNVIARKPYAYDESLLWHIESTFPYEETPDQLKALEDVISDLTEKTKPCDRLICGDAGVGKTEVALRAACICAFSGKQVALICPTTVLALQHYRTFKERLKETPFRVEFLSRLVVKSKRDEVLKGLKRGDVDIVIGTHALLSPKITFKDLGLLIVDEEQKFGVVHKEALSRLKSSFDVISITATPIPRTLKMAMAGLKDISVIRTKPLGRREVMVYVDNFSKDIIKFAIERELERHGQVFYVHPRISPQEEIIKMLEELVPARVVCIHGKLNPREIEKRMISFIEGKFDILVSTSIIAQGIDIPSVNTLIVERADMFGLSELYHLRGRVGRGDKVAFCYLLVSDNKTESAQRRLLVFKEVSSAFENVGFAIALKDLEVRGAGNLLGKEQSGFVASLGFETYTELLKEVAEELRGLKREYAEFEPKVESPHPAYIPASYIPDHNSRFSVYKAVASAETVEEIDRIVEEIQGAFGEIPAEFENFILIMKIKALARRKKISLVKVSELHFDVFFISGERKSYTATSLKNVFEAIQELK